MIGALLIFLAEIALDIPAGGSTTMVAPSPPPMGIGQSFGGDYSTPAPPPNPATSGQVNNPYGAVAPSPIGQRQTELLNQIIGNAPSTPQPNVFQTPSVSVRNLIATKTNNPNIGVISNRLGF